MRKAAIFWAVALGTLAIGPAAVAGHEQDGDRDLVVLTGGARLDAEESFHDVIVFDGDVTMDGEVRDTLVVFHGDATVSGSVGGDVIVFDGDVTIASGATVAGDVASFREPVIEDGAEVGGVLRRPTKDFFTPVEAFAARVALWIAATVSLFLLGALLLWLAPRGLDAIARTWAGSKGSAALWGSVLLVGLPLGAVLVMLTIVGIPFGLGTLFALGLLYALGYVAGTWALGRQLVGEPRSRWLSFLTGFALLRLIGLIPVVGGLVTLVTTIAGLGLLAVTIWRARTGTAPAPA